MKKRNITKILIANRGEIAIRIIRACKEMKIKTVAIYSEEDKDSLHVKLADESICIGKASPKDSYLNIPNIIAACEVLNVDAIHPGFGFLSENYKFARICEESNIKFIGPSSDVIYKMGNKVEAKEKMKEIGVPIILGYNKNIESVDEAKSIAEKVGYPVLLKATYGGGGKGIRVATNGEELLKQFKISKLEAKNCFDRDDIFIEKYIESPKHIEFQMLADEYGNVVHLGERECSMQINKQKVLEECPSSWLSQELRDEIACQAVKIAKSIGYVNAGTVEFLLDKNCNYYFLEMNTRIQVEHAITEEVTGVDIVKEQIRIANGEKIPFLQKDISVNGHAIECRINAQNTCEKFKPSIGNIKRCIMPGGKGIRVDTNIYSGYKISPYYDSMIAKVITYASSRAEAISKMERALDEIEIDGVNTNISFLKQILSQKKFIDGDYDTRFIKEMVSINGVERQG